MKIEMLSKNYTPSEKLKDIIDKKVSKLDKFFDDDTKVKILLKQIGENLFTMEITILVENGLIRAEVSSDNMYNNIDLALPKIEKQIIKHHSKIAAKSKKFREKVLVEEAVKEEQEKLKVVRSKSFELIPMTVEDAIEELELVGHTFFVFLNKSTNEIDVLYRRLDNNYGLIETHTSSDNH